MQPNCTKSSPASTETEPSEEIERRAGFKHAALVVLGVVISAAFISNAFLQWNFRGGPLVAGRFPFGAFIRALPHHLHWVLPFALLSAAIIPFRALQWKATLKKYVPFKQRLHFVSLGAVVHNLLPGQLGDLTRAYLLGRAQKIPLLSSFGSVAVCKLLEFVALVAVVTASMLGPFAGSGLAFGRLLRFGTVVCVALLGVVLAIAHGALPLARWLDRKETAPRLRTYLIQANEGLTAMRTPKAILIALMLSLPPVLCPALAYGLGLQGVGVPAGIFAGGIMLAAVSLGQGTPGVPGSMGVYYFVASWTARRLGASAQDAASFAALTHATTFLAQVTFGMVALWVRGVSWRDVRSARRAAAEASLASRSPAESA